METQQLVFVINCHACLHYYSHCYVNYEKVTFDKDPYRNKNNNNNNNNSVCSACFFFRLVNYPVTNEGCTLFMYIVERWDD
jgi:hypothetical protein